jgi:Asp-tRNA(Asn)/Glu-tRNA(Gln) amidotransferase A subunit family amidase
MRTQGGRPARPLAGLYVVSMSTFITRVPSRGDGIRLAVKDLIDVAGVPTTAGSRALAGTAAAAERDARCLAGARAAGARIVGKANLNELAFGASGVNEYFGTPVNPLDPGRVPGGSSSWLSARRTCDVIIDAEAAVSNRALLADPARRDLLSPRVRAGLAEARAVTPAQLLQARVEQERWRAAMAMALREVDLLALATVPFFPPRLDAAVRPGYLALTSPVNLAGFPALALPVPTGQRLPASLQLIGGPNAEALLLATGAMIEAAL